MPRAMLVGKALEAKIFRFSFAECEGSRALVSSIARGFFHWPYPPFRQGDDDRASLGWGICFDISRGCA
jgi:hypothetical protein